MQTHTDELKTREIIDTSKSSIEGSDENDLEEQEDDAEMYIVSEMISQQDSIVSSVVGDLLEDALDGKRIQIDPSPGWFMNTMSGLEGLLIEASVEAEETFIDTMIETDLIESDGYICGECGENSSRKEDMKEHLNNIHGHQISLENTPNVIIFKPIEEALRKKVELQEEAIKKLQNSKKMLLEDKQSLKEDKNKIIKKLEDDRDKFYRLNEKSKDSYYRLQGLNVNRIHTVIENTKLKNEAKSSEDLLQHTLDANQIMKEENDLLKKNIQLLMKEKERLEEQVQPEDEGIQNKSVEESYINKCLKCEFVTNNPTTMKGHQTKHTIHNCDKCSKQFSSKASLTQHNIDKHSQNPPVGHPVWATERNSQVTNIKCDECDEILVSRNTLENHMKNNHNDYCCVQCGETFSTKKDISNHKRNEHNNQFEGLAQGAWLPKLKCQQCNYQTNNNNELEFHQETIHKQEFQKDRRVCKYFRQGRCTRSPCPARHPESPARTSQQQKFTPACTRGPNCTFLANNRCHYFHPGVGVQMARTTQYRQQEQQGQMQYNHPPVRGLKERYSGHQEGLRTPKRCHFQQKCWNQEKCSFSHEDFRMNLEFQENY